MIFSIDVMLAVIFGALIGFAFRSDVSDDRGVADSPVSHSVEIADMFPSARPQQTTVAFVGDISFAGLTGEFMLETGATPFQFTGELLQQKDLVIGNLETNISEPGVGAPQPGKPFTFNSPLVSIDKMQGNLDAVSLANNHTNDYGPVALMNQIQLLDDAGIAHFGAGQTVEEAFSVTYISSEHHTFALFGVNGIEGFYQDVTNSRAGSAYFDEGRLRSAIEQAESQADFTIVMPHWGVEHQLIANSFQRMWAERFVSWGADIIIGAHPHVIQNVEYINGVPVYYSLGNFIFSGFSWSEAATQSYILVVTFEEDSIILEETVPIELTYQGFPKPV